MTGRWLIKSVVEGTLHFKIKVCFPDLQSSIMDSTWHFEAWKHQTKLDLGDVPDKLSVCLLELNVWSIIWSISDWSSARSLYKNSSTKDLTQFAADAIAFNRQLSQHDEEQEEIVTNIVTSMRLSRPSNFCLARQRAQSNAQRTTWDFLSSDNDNIDTWPEPSLTQGRLLP